jgi:hypothetical protein
LKYESGNEAANEGATIAILFFKGRISVNTRLISDSIRFASCEHTLIQCPQAMQRSATTAACPFTTWIAFAGHSLIQE